MADEFGDFDRAPARRQIQQKFLTIPENVVRPRKNLTDLKSVVAKPKVPLQPSRIESTSNRRANERPKTGKQIPSTAAPSRHANQPRSASIDPATQERLLAQVQLLKRNAAMPAHQTKENDVSEEILPTPESDQVLSVSPGKVKVESFQDIKEVVGDDALETIVDSEKEGQKANLENVNLIMAVDALIVDKEELAAKLETTTNEISELRRRLSEEVTKRAAVEAALKSTLSATNEDDKLRAQLAEVRMYAEERKAAVATAMLEIEMERAQSQRQLFLFQRLEEDFKCLREENIRLKDQVRVEQDKLALQRSYLLKRGIDV